MRDWNFVPKKMKRFAAALLAPGTARKLAAASALLALGSALALAAAANVARAELPPLIPRSVLWTYA